MTRIITIAFMSLALLQASSMTIVAQDKYAVLIGVEGYDPAKLGELDFAEDDAIQMGNSLEALGFHTTIMTGRARNQTLKPTNPDKIRRRLRTAMASCIEGDTMVVSLSGHGLQYVSDQPDRNGVRESYFCPEEADPTDRESLLPINDVIELLEECEASRKLLLIDACREERDDIQGASKGARKLRLGSIHETRRTVPGGMTIVYSCEQGQLSYEHENLGHSVFSHFVINYLDGNADSRYYEDRKVSLSDLGRYVSKKTNEYVTHHNISADGQLPVTSGTTTDWVLGETLDPVAATILKWAEFHGGLDKLQQARTVKIKSRVLVSTNGQSVSGQVSTYLMNDECYFSRDIGGSRFESYLSKSGGWSKEMGVVDEFSGSLNELQWLTSHPLAFVDYIDRTDEIEIETGVYKEGQNTTVLTWDFGRDGFCKCYISDEGELVLVQFEIEGEYSEGRTTAYTFKDGVKFPKMSKGTIRTPEALLTTEVETLEFEVNPKLNKEFFQYQANQVSR